jgi:hypothetical protein
MCYMLNKWYDISCATLYFSLTHFSLELPLLGSFKKDKTFGSKCPSDRFRAPVPVHEPAVDRHWFRRASCFKEG